MYARFRVNTYLVAQEYRMAYLTPARTIGRGTALFSFLLRRRIVIGEASVRFYSLKFFSIRNAFGGQSLSGPRLPPPARSFCEIEVVLSFCPQITCSQHPRPPG